jgi:hypothetical protein
MSASVPPVTIRLWARSWWLVGNGPSYLLFRTQEKRVMHLTRTTHLPRNLREALKGYQVVKRGALAPFVQALILINTRLLCSPAQGDDGIRCARHSVRVLSTIERLVNKYSTEENFEEALSRLTSNIRAARRLTQAEIAFAGGDQFAVSIDKERSKLWLSDSHDREVLVGDCADIDGSQDSFRCVPNSPIARATQALWDREQQNLGDRASCLYRVPTRKELREELLLDEPAVTKLCRAEGFGWLPRARVRDSKTRTQLRLLRLVRRFARERYAAPHPILYRHLEAARAGCRVRIIPFSKP